MARTIQSLRRILTGGIARLRERGRSTVLWTLRLTAAAVASFVVARAVFPSSNELLAPLTALLVVQLTPVSLLTSGAQRVLSVVAGVAVAVGFSSLVGLTWWSLGVMIALSLLIARILRLGSNELEVPISAMLVLGAGVAGAQTAAWQRLSETLLGAGVGVLSNLVLPPQVAAKNADAAIGDFADELARLLDQAADDLDNALQSDSPLTDWSSHWLGEARLLTHSIPNVGSALLLAEESRRLNLRALGTADTGPGLRRGLEALEHSAVAVRSMFRSLEDAGRSRELQDGDFGEDLRKLDVSKLLHQLGASVRAFGLLLRSEAQPRLNRPEQEPLLQALTGLTEAETQLSELLLAFPREDATFGELNYALHSAVERLLRELDLDDRIRMVEQQKPPPRRVVRPSRAEWRGLRRRRGSV